MRGAILAAVVCVAGCGAKPAPPTESGDPTPARAATVEPAKHVQPTRKASAPTKKEIETVGPVGYGVIQNAYKDNEIAADAAYRGKRVIVTIHEVVKIGREEVKGRPYIATHHFGHNPEPTGYLFFAEGQEAEVAKVKRGIQTPPLKVSALCLGKKEDGVNRGIKGFEFTVLFGEAKVVP